MSISIVATRLTQGADLKITVQDLVNKHGISAGSLASCVGCLSKINLRLAGAETTLVAEGSFEIVSIMGTLTPDHQHIHVAIADSKGHVFGGHLLEGNIVDSTAEVIIHSYPQLNFSRAFDPCTGYTELVIDKH
ncbi:PPC domain-containing DNA-binding protein [Endozoicomonas sp. SCSIO W0465]|uniref:PPC domain-containing DNA-binding protein n=1 Tax=Endozoicomonas sp. SCSIO W0465 TaxID=2918516 RepID=UPI0020760364|nr:PPC domain-containing DNA-binding protein [Endozoicomonas sp. SCSIO W0465]USE35957.1 DUF296 domain-containing protein [Endozoicomonas sp. SCSIO W0465]